MSTIADIDAWADEDEAVKQRSLWLDALERLLRNKAAMIGLVISLFVVFMGIFGPYLAPKDFTRTNVARRAEGPSVDYWLGTDLIGRDMMSRLMHGARTAVFVATVVIVISNTLGVTLGAVAAFAGGKIDDLIMRVADTFMGFPDLLLAAFVSTSLRRPVVQWIGALHDRTQWGFLEQTLFVDFAIVFGALALANWSGIARLVRGQILSLREQDFIRAEVALGMPGRIIIMRHLIPNSIAPVIVGMSITVGSVMLSESSLSFLGIGINPPGASWGSMIADNLLNWRVYPHLVIIPGMTLAISVFGFNFLGDGLNDALNPRQIRR